MAEIVIPDDLLELLRQVDTPTVCNAIEVAQGQRGFNRFTRGTMQHSKPGDITMRDNRATWHKAINDYHGFRRLMHRVTVDGVPLSH